ncbi:hypothetical protein HYP99_gp059 [Sinorhizobium phage ort11]|uniref:Uncharacterized protein n=1 Tax=Sinorhizobium phage ort11 TaxID=2599764 RepID=A0A5C2H1C8_9CAUD|nr:hypothetical protein HYP99_gp059 [Sinorhizobium phage ort11]QEP29857.1 hypothetical protein Smphiort11_059 [Sinorhizobium phage ort11]
MAHLVLINGYAGAGKDTFVEMVSQELDKHDIEVNNISSITPVWSLLKDHLCLPMDRKGPEERKLAAEVKAALDNYHFTATKMALHKALEWFGFNENGVCFIHMREPRALEFSKTYAENAIPGKCSTLFIDRPQPKLKIGNVADDSVNDFEYDRKVLNHFDLTHLKVLAESYARQFLP